MTRSKTFVALTVIGALALASCATLSDPAGDLAALDTAYHVYCGIKGHEAACSKANQAKEAAAVKTAQDGIAAYEAGTITQEQELALIQDVANLIAQFEKGK